MALKPQDVVTVLKLCEYVGARPPIAQLARELAMSAAEVHASMKRAEQAGLLHGGPRKSRPNVHALEEFLLHGVKYAFPAKRGGMTRGVPTAHGAPPLNESIAAGDEPIPVWPAADGARRGLEFEPLYRSVPVATQGDPFLYQCLALVDAIRGGRARERLLAEEQLVKLLRECGAWKQHKNPDRSSAQTGPAAG